MSLSMNIRSNLDSIVTGRFMLPVNPRLGMYLPCLGLPAARTEALAFSLATIPALAA